MFLLQPETDALLDHENLADLCVRESLHRAGCIEEFLLLFRRFRSQQ